MPTIAELMVIGLEKAYNRAGVDIYYNSAVEPIKGLLSYGSSDGYEHNSAKGLRGTMRIRVSDVAQVDTKDTITIDSATWGISGYNLSADGLEWICKIGKKAVS